MNNIDDTLKNEEQEEITELKGHKKEIREEYIYFEDEYIKKQWNMERGNKKISASEKQQINSKIYYILIKKNQRI